MCRGEGLGATQGAPPPLQLLRGVAAENLPVDNSKKKKKKKKSRRNGEESQERIQRERG